jgi:acetate---CoA ligase (ADP-forming)
MLKDVAYRVARVERDAGYAMLAGLRGGAIFEGARGKPARDVDAVVDTLVAVAHLAWQGKDRIAEIDINPLIVRPRGQGAVAADALFVLK